MAGLAACAQKPVRADPAEPVRPIHERIEALQLRHNARIGVYAVDFESGRTVSHLDGEIVRDVFDVQGLRRGQGASDGATR